MKRSKTKRTILVDSQIAHYSRVGLSFTKFSFWGGLRRGGGGGVS